MTESLWDYAARSGAVRPAEFHGHGASISLAALRSRSLLAHSLEWLRGRAVVIAGCEQWFSAVALLELDGVAKRIVVCPPALSAEHFASVIFTAAAEAIVVDAAASVSLASLPPAVRVIESSSGPLTLALPRRSSEASEWILLTSGTTGAPKLVSHTLQSLAGRLLRQPPAAAGTVWSTFYDIRRYGGLQIYLRAVLGGAALVLASSEESTRGFIARAAARGVTHISGTPSHWRRALMSGDAALLAPQYVRLSGEVADQPLLDALRAVFPGARIAHAFASTEAGVAFEVDDGLAGFPAGYIGDDADRGVDLRVENGTLHVRSARVAAHYLNDSNAPLAGSDGYIDTGDLVELVDGRYFFRGRRGGVINVGGLKVFPEEVEAVLNADERVRMCLVRGRRNPITGALVIADVVLADAALAGGAAAAELVREELLGRCRRALPAHKVPAMLRIVPALELTSAGKLVRPGA